jgi:hypothetical protein
MWAVQERSKLKPEMASFDRGLSCPRCFSTPEPRLLSKLRHFSQNSLIAEETSMTNQPDPLC